MEPEHAFLVKFKYLVGAIGLLHTFLSAGIVFGWASLYPVLRHEGVFAGSDQPTLAFSTAFTCGAIGNYVSNLPMGALLDSKGPRVTGITAAILMSIALALCSNAVNNGLSLIIGYGLLGFAGPAIQLPTLHLSNLFDKNGGALYMSFQAAAFDGGCFVFTACEFLAKWYDVNLAEFFCFYQVVPAMVLLTSILLWPQHSIQGKEGEEGGEHGEDEQPSGSRPHRSLSNLSNITSSPGGPGSPFLGILSKRAGSEVSEKDDPLNALAARQQADDDRKGLLQAMDLRSCLATREFLFLGLFTSIHILKLNFVVSSINDQLNYAFRGDEDSVDDFVAVFGIMLPFGFVILPFTAYLLQRGTVDAMLVANCFAVVYTCSLALHPTSFLWQICVTFPLVAVSRQLVYSTVFYMVGEYFGFRNYGVILGLINLIVSATSILQYALVMLAEQEYGGDYLPSNMLLLAVLVPLLFAGRILSNTGEAQVQAYSDKIVKELRSMRIKQRSEECKPMAGEVKKVASYQALK